jgi:PncC family amidohydrolase
MADDVQAAPATIDDPLVVLAARLGAACLERGVRVVTAESCTGGLVGHLITEVDGSSRYFRGALVAYADGAKTAFLGVPAATIAAHGAVSAQVAVAMAHGARERAGADLAVAVTGIAGPGGGSAAKPVGLTYVAVVGPAGSDVRRFTWTGDRTANKRASAAAALEMLLEAAVAPGPGGEQP